jgi:ubiquinone/menaquinone biosynthesis C-methylase UbiE
MSRASQADPPGAIIVPTREGYDRWSAVYDGDANPLVALEEPHVARMLGEVRGLRIADIGSGTGRHAIRLANAGARVTALDFSAGMIARARAKSGAERVRFAMADCSRQLPLRDSGFDRVISCLIADHVPSLEMLFSELKRICARDGFIVMTTVHPAMHLKGVRARFTDPATGSKVYPASYEYSISDFVNAASRCGLRFDEISEHVLTAEHAADNPRALPYVGWPMLLAMRLSQAGK